MISIIIASADKELFDNVSLNIANTIGTEYEIISIDNSNGEKGLCEIYNWGAEQAQFEYLCYMHEDICIETENWGEKILDIFNRNEDFGIIGLAGCKYKSVALSGWGAEYQHEDIVFINYIQTYKYAYKPRERVYFNPTNASLEEVATVDGMWFCTRKSIVQQHKFDQKTFDGFHAYDLDFCINVGLRYKIGVTFEILIDHFSDGNFSKEWLVESIKLHKKWIDVLPVNKLEVNSGLPSQIEKKTFKKAILLLVDNGYRLKQIISIISQYYKHGKISIKSYLKLIFFALKQYGKRQRK